jgi:hypothetical protein
VRFIPKSGLRQALLVTLARALRRMADWAEPAPQAATETAPEPAAGDPPADWLERVRKGAPELLVLASEGGVPEQLATLPQRPAPPGPSIAQPPRAAPARQPDVPHRSSSSPRQPLPSSFPAAPPPAVARRRAAPAPAPRIEAAKRIAAPSKPAPHDDAAPRTAAAPRPAPPVDAAPRTSLTPAPTSLVESAEPKRPSSATPAVDSERRPNTPVPAPPRKAPAAIRIRPTVPLLRHESASPPPAPDTTREATQPQPWPELPAAVREPESPRTPPAAAPPAAASRPKPRSPRPQWPAAGYLQIPPPPVAVNTESAARTRVAPSVAEPQRAGRDRIAVASFDFPPNVWPELPDDPATPQHEWAGTLERAARIRNLLAEQRGEAPWSA